MPSQAHRSLVQAENALSDQSLHHPDGWGIGWILDDDAYVIKSANAAHACDRFQRASQRLTSHTFLAHVRRATVGTVEHVNAHPFRCGRWLFAHNGTIFGFDRIRGWLEDRIEPGLRPLIHGDTDSERLFFFVLSRLGQAGIDPTGRSPSGASMVAQIVRGALLELDALAVSLGMDRPILNVLLTDGRLLVAHRAGMPLLLSTQKRCCADLHTCTEPSKVCMEPARSDAPVNHLSIASERIGEEENRWENIADGATVLLDNHFRITVEPPMAGWEAPVLPPGAPRIGG